MSTSATTSASATKGEKGKSKYAALNINNLYKGNSVEPQTKTVAPKHGMQSLGKVPSARRAPQPVNLPSLRAESGSSSTPSADSTLAASSSSPPPPSLTPTVSNSTAPASNSGWIGSAADLAVQQKHPTPSQSPAPVPFVAQTNPAVAVQPVTILDQKFQQEFPSLVAQPSSVGSVGIKQRQQQQQPPALVAPVEPTPRQESPQPMLQYGPGPSLRPQNEGSWAPGGRPSPSQGGPGPGDGLGGQGAGALPPGPGGPNQRSGVQQQQMTGPPLAVRSVMPPFMFRSGQVPPGGGGNYPPPAPYQPSSSQYGPRCPPSQGGRFSGPSVGGQDGRYRQGPKMGGPTCPSNDPEELYPRPIIKEEDLRRMDEISGDDGWAAFQDEPDYDKKLFEDDAPTGSNSNEAKDQRNHILAPSNNKMADEEMARADRDGKWADNIQAQGRAIAPTPPLVQVLTRDRNSGGCFTQGEFRREPALSNSSGSRPLSLEEDELLRHQKSVEMKAAQRAKEKREEEERRFEQNQRVGERSNDQRRIIDSERSGDPRRLVDGERFGDHRRIVEGSSNRDRDRDRNHLMNDDRVPDKYDRSSQSRLGNSDYFNRNAPPAVQLAPRFLKQKQQHQSGRMEEDSQQRSGPPQSWSRDRGGDGYDLRGNGGRDWHERDRDRELYKRPSEVWPRGGVCSDGEKRLHRNDQPPGPTSGGRDRIEKDTITIKRKESERKSESHELESLERPNSRNSRTSQDKESNAKALSLPAPKEIVSWADEPGDEDLSSPSTAPTTDRGFSEEKRVGEGSSCPNKVTNIDRNVQHPVHHHPSPPTAISREKNFEVDPRRSENKQQPTLVSLRRIPGPQQQSPVSSNVSTTMVTSYTDESNKKPQQQRSPPTEAVHNVWASRTKANRDQPSDSIGTESTDKHGDDSDISRKGPHSHKDPRGRHIASASSASSSKIADGLPVSSTSSTTVRHGGGLQRRRGSNSRYSGSYDEYEDDYRPEPSKASSTGAEGVSTRKSKSPELDDRSKKDAPSKGTGNSNARQQQQQSGSGSGAGGSFRMRRGAIRGGYDEEESSAPYPPRSRDKDGPAQLQQRSSRLHQDEPAHKSSKEEHWGDEHHNDSSLGRSNNPRRSGGGNGRGPVGSASARGRSNKGDDYEVSNKESAHVADGRDHHPERKSDGRGSKVEEHNNKRPDRRNEAGKEARNEKNRERVERGGGAVRANDQDRGGYRTGGGQSSKGSCLDQQRYEQRPKTNLPPRLAKLETANRLKGHKSESGELGHPSSAEVSSAAIPPAKESTPPVTQQLQSPVWDKNGAPAAAPSPTLTNAMTSLALVEQQNTEKPQPFISAADEVVLDGTTPPSTTIIFENTNLKSSTCDLKGRGTPPGVPQQGPKAHVQQQQHQKAQPLPNVATSATGSYPTTTSAAPSSGGLQLAVGSSKTASSASGPINVSQRIQHITSAGSQPPISPSTADLNMKIASVKKVWDMPALVEHHAEADGSNTSSNNATSGGGYPGSGYTEAEHHHHQSTSDISQDAYNAHHHHQQQQQAQVKMMEGNGVSNNICKVKPQQQQLAAMAAAAAAAAQGMSSSPTFATSNVPPTGPGPTGLGSATLVGPLGYPQYGGMPAVPSPPSAMAAVYGSASVGQAPQQAPPPPHQASIYGPFLDTPGHSQFSLLQVLSGPGNPGRSQFSHFNLTGMTSHGVGLSGLGSLTGAPGGPAGPFAAAAQQNLLYQQPPPPTPATAPPGVAPGSGAPSAAAHQMAAMNDLYHQSSQQYRLAAAAQVAPHHGPYPGHGHGVGHAVGPQSQHANPAPMLISSNNSLGLKSSAYGSIGQSLHGSIGAKSAYQQQPSGHQHSQMYFPYDPSSQVLNMGPMTQMGGQSYLSNSQLLQQQARTGPPPPQVQAIQPPPSSFYSAGPGAPGQGGAGGANHQGGGGGGYYQQTVGGPSPMQQQQQHSMPQMGPPQATPAPGPFSLPGFASQAGLQGFANRAAQQQQQQQQQQYNQQMGMQQQQQQNRYPPRNGPGSVVPSQQQQQIIPPTGPLGSLQFSKPAPSASGPSPGPPAPSPGQYMPSSQLDENNKPTDSQQASSGTSPKSRSKMQLHPSQQQQQISGKFPGGGGGAYPGPPSNSSVIRAPFSVRTSGPPPSQPPSGGGNGNLIGSGGGNAPRYPTPIQRPTASQNSGQNPHFHSSSSGGGGPPGAPSGAGLGARPRAPHPHPARIPGSGSAPGQPSHSVPKVSASSNSTSTTSTATTTSAEEASIRMSSIESTTRTVPSSEISDDSSSKTETSAK